MEYGSSEEFAWQHNRSVCLDIAASSIDLHYATGVQGVRSTHCHLHDIATAIRSPCQPTACINDGVHRSILRAMQGSAATRRRNGPYPAAR
jgi:hypothetical protein